MWETENNVPFKGIARMPIGQTILFDVLPLLENYVDQFPDGHYPARLRLVLS